MVEGLLSEGQGLGGGEGVGMEDLVERPALVEQLSHHPHQAGRLHVRQVGGGHEHAQQGVEVEVEAPHGQREQVGEASGKAVLEEGGYAGVGGVVGQALVDGLEGGSELGGELEGLGRGRGGVGSVGEVALVAGQRDGAVHEGVQLGDDLGDGVGQDRTPQPHQEHVDSRGRSGTKANEGGELARSSGHGSSGVVSGRRARTPRAHSRFVPARLLGAHGVVGEGGGGGTSTPAGARPPVAGEARAGPQRRVSGIPAHRAAEWGGALVHGALAGHTAFPSVERSGPVPRRPPSLVFFGLIGCQGTFVAVEAPRPADTLEVGSHAPLHRLTEAELNRSLADLFSHPSLPLVDLPLEVEVGGFSNQAHTRDATPYLVESLQVGLTAVAAQVVADGGAWLPCAPDGGADPVECGSAALDALQPRAWRRPVTEAERAWLVEGFESDVREVGFTEALTLAVALLLQSPDFLYAVEGEAPDGQARLLTDWELAVRLSLVLWQSIPDAELRQVAADGTLHEPAVLQAQAERMLADPRADTARLRFFQAWLGRSLSAEVAPSYDHVAPVVLSAEELEELEEIRSEGSPDALQHYEEEWGFVVTELQTTFQAEFDLYLEHVVLPAGTLDALLTRPETFASARTARLYGVEVHGSPAHTYVPEIEDDDVYPVDLYAVTLPEHQRMGLLTHGAFLAGLSHPDQPSPIARSVFLRERLLCLVTGAPPDDVPAISTPAADAPETNRARFEAHTADPACASCHTAIDGTGFPFEHYDAIGAWRDTDAGQPVDASGALVGTDVDGPVEGALDLIRRLASSRQVHDCAVTQLYRYAFHHAEDPQDTAALRDLQDSFWASGGDLDRLWLDLVTSGTFRSLRPADLEAP